MNIIGHISTDFPTKFGIPRQSGLIEELKGVITFEPEYRQPEAFRGLEDFSHIWVLWQFSKSQKKTIASTVTPPRLGGKVRMGVFATRSPFRPNDIGMSCVKLEHIEYTAATYNRNLKVIFPSDLLAIMPENKQTAAVKILEQDPRPAYDTDESRAYGVTFSGFDIRFKVHGDVLTVFEVVDIEAAGGYKKVK